MAKANIQQQNPDALKRFRTFVRQSRTHPDHWVCRTLLDLVLMGEILVAQGPDGEFRFKPTGR